MARGGMIKNMTVAAAAVIMLMLMKGTAADTWTVGDDNGWRVPTTSDFYSSWAAKHTFVVGDTLVFNFLGSHTVAMVTSKDAYDNCDAKDAKIDKVSPVKVPLTTEGEFFFFCTVPGHCTKGQKFAINVTAAGAKALPPADSRSSPESPPHDKGSAPNPMARTLSTFSLCLVALVMALGYY